MVLSYLFNLRRDNGAISDVCKCLFLKMYISEHAGKPTLILKINYYYQMNFEPSIFRSFPK